VPASLGHEAHMTKTLTYYAPASLEEALDRLSQLGTDATVLAGGQDVVPRMNQGQLSPTNIIDLKALKNLVGTETANGAIVIRALSTHRTIERSEAIQNWCGLLADAASQIGGGIQVRNRGTIGGAVCAGSPAYDFLPCLVALDAEFRLLSSVGERRLPASEFFRDVGKTALRPDEILTEITVPKLSPDTGFSYQKLKFSDGCYSIASAACTVKLNLNESFAAARLALGGVAPVPIRLRQVEAMVGGARVTEKLLGEVAAATEQAVTNPITDVQADGEYRRAMAGVMAKRALTSAFERARHKGKGERT